MAGRSSVDDRKLRPIQTQSVRQRPSTAPHNGPGTPTSNHERTPPQRRSAPEDKAHGLPVASARPGHQPFVLTDPIAFRYLEADPSTEVLAEQRKLHGYECYIVEQWTTSRTHPTFVITTYTGDQSHAVTVGVLSVPVDETTWSRRLRVYFKALNQYHAKRRETPLGILMVTTLSGFPSSLTVILVPDGDVKTHRFDFYVNENLKRLGCSGRVGLTLAPPSSATIAKFHQLYRTSDKIELYKSVIELVKLCQSALMLFDKLEIDYADGLLCDVTERAINDWWVEIGNGIYNIEPHDGILGPTTVAGLLGLLMGARNRLHSMNAPVAKDAFDVDAMKRGIGHFQKQQHMTRTRRLDRRTLERLHKATQKAADHEGWTMPRVMKNTVAEISGKGGEMVMDAVGRRDRAGIAEIETCDIERFVQLIYGERCKWLWLGKPLKKARQREQQREGQAGNKGLVFKSDEHGGFTWTTQDSSTGLPAGNQEHPETGVAPARREDDSGDEEARFGMFKRASGLASDAKSGLGKFKGAVGLKTNQQKASVDDAPKTPVDDSSRQRRPLFRRSHSSPMSSPSSPQSPVQDQGLDAALFEQRQRGGTDSEHVKQALSYDIPEGQEVSQESMVPPSNKDDGEQQSDESEKQPDFDRASYQPSVTVSGPSIAGSVYNDIDLDEALPTGPETEKDIGASLRRTLSLSHFITVQMQHRSDEAYPRHLSFSLAEDSVLTWPDVTEEDGEGYHHDARADLAVEELLAKQAKHLRLAINALSTTTAPWTQTQLRTLDGLLQQADRDQQTLESMHMPQVEHLNALQMHSEGVLREQRERLEEGGKEIETLAAKLEYEINGLRGKVEDVQNGVNDFEKGVSRIEDRLKELEKDEDKVGRWGCVVS